MLKNDSDIIVTINNLVKKFNRKTILHDINLEISCADSIAFIGRNGCGKSTLLKIIGGLISFNSGQVTYLNKLKINYVPDNFPAMNITAREYIYQMGKIEGLSHSEILSQSQQLFKDFFMEQMIDTPIKYLSKGTMQKVSVVQAFLSQPDILIMDEPISGQDYQSQLVFIDMVNRLNREYGTTILFACHEDYLINQIAKSVYEIFDGSLRQIKNFTHCRDQKTYCLHFVRNENSFCQIPDALRKFSAKIYGNENSHVEIYVGADESDFVIGEMLRNNFNLRGINNEIIF